MRFWGPNPLAISWAKLHEFGSNLADVCLRAGPEMLGTVACGTRVGPEPGRYRAVFRAASARVSRYWAILALERLYRDFSAMATSRTARPNSKNANQKNLR